MKRIALTVALLMSSAAITSSATGQEPPTAVSLSSTPVAEDGAWRAAIISPQTPEVYPKHAYVVAGDPSSVSNLAGLTHPGSGTTTITATGKGTPQIVLDLGINVGGIVEVGVRKTDGSTIHLGYSEARAYLTADGDQPRKDDPTQARMDDITSAGAFRSPDPRGAQRWISLQLQSAGQVSIDYVRIRVDHLNPTARDFAGHFLSSDPLINRIWYASAYTFAMDSVPDQAHPARTVVVDGAKRDRALWLADLDLEANLGIYSLRQAPAAIRRSLQAFSCRQTTDGQLAISEPLGNTVCPDVPPTPTKDATTPSLIPDYAAWWPIGLWDYYLLTGDAGFAKRMLPVARRVAAYYLANLDTNGLFRTPPTGFNWHVFDIGTGEDAHSNAAVYRSLRAVADLERTVGGRAAAATTLDRDAARLRAAMLAHLWDAGAGAFLGNSEDPLPNHTQDAQVEAVLDGLLTGPAAAQALAFLDKNLRTPFGTKSGEYDEGDPYRSQYISPYMSSTELLARLSVGDANGALDLMRRSWGHMVTSDPGSTVWERMSLSGGQPLVAPAPPALGDAVPTYAPNFGAGFGSLAHGWGGGPVPALSGYVLGIRPVRPGWSAWVVQPQVGDLRWAQGQAPAASGAVVSRWERGTRSFRLTAGGPAGTTGSVSVPLLGSPRTIARDGHVVWANGRPVGPERAVRVGDEVRFDGVQGLHTWAWTAPSGP
jgi:alpha-L-rhamnosidase